MTTPIGLFIALEGGEGAGKSTLIRTLAALFEAAGREVLTLREPGGTPYAEQIRTLFLETEGLSDESVALLMNAGRVDNIEKIIQPALAAGKIVIADRFSASTLVYQGLLHGHYDVVAPITKHIPMISIFVDVPPEIGLARIHGNGRETNRMDHLPVTEHQRIYEGFHALAHLQPEIYWDLILDGTQEVDALAHTLETEIVPRLIAASTLGLKTADVKADIRKLGGITHG